MVPICLFLFLLASAARVAGEILDADKMSPALALFFYYGYLNEYGAHQRWTTIGGRPCRDRREPCTFDQFLDATTRPGGQGGYRGGQVVDDKSWNAPIKRMADSLQRRGLTGAIDWDPEKLIVGARPDRDVYEDHIRYVLNAFNEDRGRRGHQQNYHNKAIDALTLVAEINARHVSDGLVKWYRDQGVLLDVPDAYKTVKLPAEGDPSEGVARTVIDGINFFKTWAYEAGRGDSIMIAEPPWEKRARNSDNDRLGLHLAESRLSLHSCRSGPSYPRWELPEIDTSPVNWGDLLTPRV